MAVGPHQQVPDAAALEKAEGQPEQVVDKPVGERQIQLAAELKQKHPPQQVRHELERHHHPEPEPTASSRSTSLRGTTRSTTRPVSTGNDSANTRSNNDTAVARARGPGPRRTERR